MSLPEVVVQYLRHHHIQVEEHMHPAAYTAHELAEVEHFPESSVVKVVFFYCDDQLVMGMLPANRHLSLQRAKKLTNAERVRLATEQEIAGHIDTLQLGAIPPFGSILGLPVLMDESLKDVEAIEIPAGDNTRSFRMRMEDFLREEAPQVLELSRGEIHHKSPPTKPKRMEHF